MLSTFNILKISIFGESHGSQIGVVIEGLPCGHKIDTKRLQEFCDRRKSGNNGYSTARKEADIIEIVSGLKDCFTTGAPLCAIVKNTNALSKDYSNIINTPRPSHADYVASVKYNGFADINGGGHFSGRLTLPLCISGGIAAQILAENNIEAGAYITGIADINCDGYRERQLQISDIRNCYINDIPALDKDKILKMLKAISVARENGDSVGGVIECVAFNVPIGLGGALFNGLEGRIAANVYAIPSVKAVEFGLGFGFSKAKASDVNDEFFIEDGMVRTRTNNNGGINGGISNGMPITLCVAIKPTPSISKQQNTVDLNTKSNTTIKIGGRHDACIVPRAVVCVESAVNLTLLDSMLEIKKV